MKKAVETIICDLCEDTVRTRNYYQVTTVHNNTSTPSYSNEYCLDCYAKATLDKLEKDDVREVRICRMEIQQ